MDFRLPDLCARCGAAPPSRRWTIRDVSGALSAWTLLTMWGGDVATTRRLTSFEVGVCDPCHETLAAVRARCRRLPWYGLLAGAGIPLAALSIAFKGGWLLGLIAGSVIGVTGYYVGQNVLPWFVRRSRGCMLGRFNGRHYRFSNAEFHRQFAALNPGLVKTRRKPD